MFVRGGRQRLAPRGHGELHALAAHGDRGLQRGRVAGGHGGCGERATGCLGSARVRGVAMASRIAEMAHSARNEVGGGIGGEDGRRTRAFARGERHDAGGDMRSRLVGGVHAAWDSHRAGRGVPRADRSARQFTLFAWKIFWIRHPERPRRAPETRSPSEGSRVSHTHSRRDVRACRWVAPPRGPRFAPRLERRARWDARSTLPPPPAPDARVRVPRGERRVQIGTSARDARPPPRVVAAGTTCVVPPGGDPR